ncbi:MAG: rpmC [Dehalococcoidia bacterium]|nr:rpmC [Dehalococcoidia bacterium]
MSKASEFRDLADVELKERLDASYKELFSLRFRLATQQLANHRELPKVRRGIARIKTVMREREFLREMVESLESEGHDG